MRLSTLGRYALRAMVDLALHQDQGAVLRKDIVARQGISGSYLAHLFGKLRQARLIQSVMGPGGGYVLARNASTISAADVLRAVDESINPVFCVDPDAAVACPRQESCATHPLWKRLGSYVVQLLDSVTLVDLCEQSRSLAAGRKLDPDHEQTSTSGGRLKRRRGQFDSRWFADGAGV